MSGGHTPGGWVAVKMPCALTDCSEFHINSSAGYIASVDSSRDSDENAANARLIASAPELLAMLTEICDRSERIRSEGYNPRTSEAEAQYQRARALIAKATGSGFTVGESNRG